MTQPINPNKLTLTPEELARIPVLANEANQTAADGQTAQNLREAAQARKDKQNEPQTN